MIDYTAEVTIDVPAARVYRAVTDAAKWSMWTPMRDTKVLSGTGFDQLGSRIESVMSDSPGKPKLIFEVTAAESNRRVAFKTVSQGSVAWDGELRLEAVSPSATRLTTTGQIRTSGLFRLLEPFVSGEVRKGEQKEIEKLKVLLETDQM